MKMTELKQAIVGSVLKVMMSEKVKFMIRTIIREEIALSNVGTPMVQAPTRPRTVIEQPIQDEPVQEARQPARRPMTEEQKRDAFFMQGRRAQPMSAGQLLGMDANNNTPAELKPKFLQDIYKTKFTQMK